MTSGIASKGVDLDNIFHAYVSGTHPPATGIKVNGVDIATRYQPLPGTAAPATGIMTGGADLNTLFSTTASTPLPIDGETFTGAVTVTTGSKTAFIAFAIVNGNSYQVTGASDTGTKWLGGGTVPAGAITVKYTFGAYTVPSGSDAGGSTTNDASSATAVSGNPGASYVTNSWGSSAGTHERQYPFTIDFYNSSGANISHTLIYLAAIVEPAT